MVVSVSNGGVDVVPPLISFYAPFDGQIVSGNVNIGVNASDNDQVALGYVSVTHAFPGSKVVVEIAGRPVGATVTPTPFFDPAGSRLRAKSSDAPRRAEK